MKFGVFGTIKITVACMLLHIDLNGLPSDRRFHLIP